MTPPIDPPAAELFRFRERLRVRYNECDPQGIVFNGNYFVYLDIANTEYLHLVAGAHGSPIRAGTDVVVAESRIRFHASARLRDDLTVATRVAHLGRTSLIFEFRIDRDADAALIATAQIAYVTVDNQTFRPVPIPDPLRAAILAYEGERLAPPRPITPLLDRFNAPR